jgi:iron complex outermembrane receptor protein
VRYSADTWAIVAGVRNVFDEEPALVDPGENFELNGTNRFAGHDFLGRRFFVNVSKSF